MPSQHSLFKDNAPRFMGLREFVEGYFAGSYPHIFPSVAIHLHKMLQPLREIEMLSYSAIAETLDISEHSAKRFIDRGVLPSRTMVSRMILALAEQFDIDTKGLRAKAKGAQSTARRRVDRDLDELEEALSCFVPASEYTPGMNRQPIDLTSQQYALLLATIHAAQSFSQVPS